jgi:RNA polymerase sigma-70 factor (ECF subfamily)
MAIDPDDLVAESADLYRFALSITRDPIRAADLSQDTIIRALEREDQFRTDADLGPWLRRIAHNLAIDRARRGQREILVEETEDRWRDDEYSIDPSVLFDNAQTRDAIEDALARLPFIYRSVVILHDVDGWKVREIAELQEITIPAAKQRLRRGRMALTTALADGAERRKNLQGVPMQCWDARQHVSDYLDNTLDPATKHLVESHLGICPTCPLLYAALVNAHQSLGTLRDPDAVIPPQLEARIRTLVATPNTPK